MFKQIRVVQRRQDCELESLFETSQSDHGHSESLHYNKVGRHLSTGGDVISRWPVSSSALRYFHPMLSPPPFAISVASPAVPSYLVPSPLSTARVSSVPAYERPLPLAGQAYGSVPLNLSVNSSTHFDSVFHTPAVDMSPLQSPVAITTAAGPSVAMATAVPVAMVTGIPRASVAECSSPQLVVSSVVSCQSCLSSATPSHSEPSYTSSVCTTELSVASIMSTQCRSDDGYAMTQERIMGTDTVTANTCMPASEAKPLALDAASVSHHRNTGQPEELSSFASSLEIQKCFTAEATTNENLGDLSVSQSPPVCCSMSSLTFITNSLQPTTSATSMSDIVAHYPEPSQTETFDVAAEYSEPSEAEMTSVELTPEMSLQQKQVAVCCAAADYSVPVSLSSSSRDVLKLEVACGDVVGQQTVVVSTAPVKEEAAAMVENSMTKEVLSDALQADDRVTDELTNAAQHHEMHAAAGCNVQVSQLEQAVDAHTVLSSSQSEALAKEFSSTALSGDAVDVLNEAGGDHPVSGTNASAGGIVKMESASVSAGDTSALLNTDSCKSVGERPNSVAVVKATSSDAASQHCIGAKDATDRNEKFTRLMLRCTKALELCLTRFPQHYKSLYRLADVFYRCSTLKVSQAHATLYSFSDCSARHDLN